ncbi:MAG: glycosyltransferase family 4 protein [Bacteroidales bacterium]|jgi:glycosyltransferase involved in cell wall biosynthesis|nr:glycosyltransferase family 4 protein [Bacteroidales bacterium]
MKYKIIVGHSGKQHSFQTANALNKYGNLYKYITTVYNKPYSFTRLLTSVLIEKNKIKILSRKNLNLGDYQVKQFCELRGLVLLFALRVPFFFKLFPNYFQYVHNSFGRKVAKYAIKENVDAVIMYDTDALCCFKILQAKAPHIKRILDVSIASRLFSKSIYEQDALLYNDSYILKERSYSLNKRILCDIEKEISLTDYFLVGSQFVQRSLEYNNIDSKKINIIPYGIDITKFTYKVKKKCETPLKLIFTGNDMYRKGIHHLLNVVSQFDKTQVVLTIVGVFSNKEYYYQQYAKRDNIHFTGFVTHDTLSELYHQADVFVLPSLAEGFAQVSIEAMSCGLPVICTENSGCNDAIVDYENGFVIKASDREALKNRIEWCIQNKDKLVQMGKNARKIATSYTWEHYYDKIASVIDNIMKQ